MRDGKIHGINFHCSSTNVWNLHTVKNSGYTVVHWPMFYTPSKIFLCMLSYDKNNLGNVYARPSTYMIDVCRPSHLVSIHSALKELCKYSTIN